MATGNNFFKQKSNNKSKNWVEDKRQIHLTASILNQRKVKKVASQLK